MGPIPAKYFWPGFVTLLLTFSVGSGVVTVMAAFSDGGAEVVSGYAEGDESLKRERRQARQNRALDWSVDLQPVKADGDGPTTIELTVTDSRGTPLAGLDGKVTLRSPAKSDPLGESTLAGVPGKEGTYRTELPVDRRGLWDFVVELKRNEAEFIKTYRREI
jgi:hypothetical protein